MCVCVCDDGVDVSAGVVVASLVNTVEAVAVVVRCGKSIKTEKKRKRATPSGKTGVYMRGVRAASAVCIIISAGNA